jgi:hypothetical protein
MTRDEFREVLSSVVEMKVFELPGDPDDGLPVLPDVAQRLRIRQARVRAGERGHSLDEVGARLGLA